MTLNFEFHRKEADPSARFALPRDDKTQLCLVMTTANYPTQANRRLEWGTHHPLVY